MKTLKLFSAFIFVLYVGWQIRDMKAESDHTDLITHETYWAKCYPEGKEVTVARIINGRLDCEKHEYVPFGEVSNKPTIKVDLDSPI